ncbi:MAG: sulfite exporter TauE/SafE family protein [Acidimicrobiales bacterium]|nr:sulfite exporter TauE/SafE family protein [Acidimicrobiales bacterium]
MVVPGIVSNVLLIRDNLGHLAETRHLLAMVLSGVVGVAAGTYVLTTVDDEVMSLILAAGVIGIYLMIDLLHPSFSIQGAVARLTAAPIGFLGGVLQGGTGVSSPLLSPYLHAYRMPRSAYVVSITTLFLVFAIIQMGALAVAGLYTLERLALGLARSWCQWRSDWSAACATAAPSRPAPSTSGCSPSWPPPRSSSWSTRWPERCPLPRAPVPVGQRALADVHAVTHVRRTP